MNYTTSLFSLAVALGASCGLAHAQSDRCVGSLIKDANSSSVDTATAFAMSDLIRSSSTSEDKQKSSLTVPIDGVPVELGSSRARKLSQQFSRQTDIQWSQATSVQAVSSTLSANSVEAYRICVNGQHTSGSRVVVYDTTPTQATVKVTWWSPSGAPTSARADVSLSGGTPQKPFPVQWNTGTSFIVVVDRKPRQDLRITANIGGMADAVTVPYIPSVIVRRTNEAVQTPSDVLRLANDGTGRNQGPISDCYFAPDDAEIRADSAAIAWVVRAGSIDTTSYAKIKSQDDQRVCWEAYLRPLVRTGGGDMQFRIKYQLTRWSFAVR